MFGYVNGECFAGDRDGWIHTFRENPWCGLASIVEAAGLDGVQVRYVEDRDPSVKEAVVADPWRKKPSTTGVAATYCS